MKTTVTIALLIVSILLAVLVLMQEGKSNGLSGSLSGGSDSSTYWGKNKGRSKESLMVKATIFLGALFIILSLLLVSKYI